MNGLTIGISDQGKPILRSQFQKDLNANEKEMLVAEHFTSVINAAKPDVVVTLERRSDNYLSLCLKENDFCVSSILIERSGYPLIPLI